MVQCAPFIRLWIFESGCEAVMRRNVPDRERMTMESVSTRSPTTRTPRRSAPFVTLAGDEVVCDEHPVDLVAGLEEPLALVVVPRPQLPLHRAAQALDRGRRDHTLGRAADPHEEVDPGPHLRGGDRRRDVAVADEVDARAGLADLGNEFVMAVALEDDDGEVVDVDLLRLCDAPEVLRRGRVDVDRVGRLGPDGDLVHVQGGTREEHRPPLGDGDDRDRIRHPERRQPRSLERIHGDVHLGPVAVAHGLPVEEHRRLVLLPLADHDDASHAHGVEHEAHRVDGRLVGCVLVSTPDPARGEGRRRLGDSDELEREVAVGVSRQAHVS
jgi:hypothetical protein